MVAGQLRIAMLSSHSCPLGKLGGKDTGGMSVYIRELARGLGRQGYFVDIYTRAHDPMDNQIVQLGENVRLIHLKAGEIEEMHKLVVYSHLSDFACNLENFRKRNGLQYDLVHSHYWLSGLVGGWLQQWWHVPHITMFHTLGAAKNVIGVGEDETELRLETEKELAKSCYHIIAATEKEKEEFSRNYDVSPDSISVIPCGVNLDLFRPVNKQLARQQLGLNNDNIILFVGRIDPLKGIDKLLMAVTYLEKRQGLRLLIVGGDHRSQFEVERLQKLSQELGIEGLVTFLGTVKQEELPRLYSAANTCVVPSYYESFGLVALESLACGTPVVATKVGGIEDIIRQAEMGYVITDNAPHRLADKIALLLAKPDIGAESINSIRASVARFSWSNIAEAVVREYRAALRNYLSQEC